MTKLETAVGCTDRDSHDRNSRYGSEEPCNLAASRRGRHASITSGTSYSDERHCHLASSCRGICHTALGERPPCEPALYLRIPGKATTLSGAW